VCCSVLQSVAVCYSMLQYVAVCYSVLGLYSKVFGSVAGGCSVLECVAESDSCSALQRVAACYSVF